MYLIYCLRVIHISYERRPYCVIDIIVILLAHNVNVVKTCFGGSFNLNWFGGF